MREIFKIMQTKEKNHNNYQKFFESLLLKAESIFKTYKLNEKTFTTALSKVLKEATT